MIGLNVDLTPEQTIETYFEELGQKFSKQTIGEPEFRRWSLNTIEDLFALNRLSAQVLQHKWSKLDSVEQESFMEAIKLSFQNRLVTELKQYDKLPKLNLVSKEHKENFATLKYVLLGGNERQDFTIYMTKYSQGHWKISNLKVGDKSLMREYYSFCDNLLDKYSFEYLIGELSGQGFVVLEDFETSKLGGLPRDWTWKDSDDKKHKPYEIKKENGNKFLAARDEGETVILGKEVRWNLKKYPYISFRWRVWEIPEGGDERYNETNDSGAAIYITYKKKLGLIPESVKYLWSTTLPVGTATQRNGWGRPWNIVAASGEAKLGEWRTFTFNAYEAYKKTFRGDPPDAPIGIGILSDANSTDSKAYADYDDIRALMSADADSGIRQFMKGYD